MEFEQIDEGDHVFSIEAGVKLSSNHPDRMYRTPELLKFALAQFGTALGNWGWLSPGNGIGGELLKIGGSRWVPGRIRFRVIMEFCPNEPEPPALPKTGLDEFRQ